MSSSGEVYGIHILPDKFNTDILLPNGLVITLSCKREYTLEAVKKQVWKTINSTYMKLFKFSDQSSYVFSGITYDGDYEEFFQETRRICDLRLFELTLKLIEHVGDKEERKINNMIDIAIGKKVSELLAELPKDIREEVIEFRKDTRDYEEDLQEQLKKGELYSSYSSYVDEPFSMRIISASYVNVRNIDSIFVRAAVYHGTECLGFKDTNQAEPSNPKWDQWLKFDFHCTDLPRSAKICLSICLKSNKKPKCTYALGSVNFNLFNYKGFMRTGKYQFSLWPAPKYTEDLLFPHGNLGNNPHNDSASLLLELVSFDKHVIFAPIEDIYYYANHAIHQEPNMDADSIRMPALPSTNTNSDSINSSSNCYTHYSSIKVDFRDRTLSNSCADTRAFIERRLSSSSNNRRDSVSTTYNDSLISNRSRRPTASSDKVSVASRIRTESFRGHDFIMTTTPTTAITPPSELVENLPSQSPTMMATPTATIDSPTSCTEATTATDVLATSSVSTATTSSTIKPESSPLTPSPPPSSTTPSASNLSRDEEQDITLVNELIATPPFTPLSPQQKLLLWRMRFYCKRVPESLPKLLDAIDWKSRNQLSQMYVLLDEWEQVSLETALRLLDSKYEDMYVRQHAVQWLDKCIDEEMLSCYLLQFVQVLKTEPYLDNELSSFLAKRALLNPQIGNMFFWYLRSECDEISDYHNTTRFRYLLERYLKSLTKAQLVTLNRQVHGLDKLMNLAEALKDNKEVGASREEKLRFMHMQLKRVDFMEVLQNIPDPINCKRLLGDLRYDECRIMDSAKKPLWLVWSIPDSTATSAIIFKVGDDLRQDMLTLQIIRIVDAIWRSEGLDMCMLAYTCLATGKNVGIIEVVKRAETISSIQKSGGRMSTIQIDSTHLHRWIKERNADNYDQAIDRFTRSCAGYSVLTFVLGIADRNPDNIMVSEDGRIFHIDFGHFLGHFKKKFGINRERVPFVLTHDFIHVIACGSDARKSGNFDSFRDLCHEAYISLRKHSNLLITLFTMMLRTGIPELRTIDDISHLKSTLQIGFTEEEAHAYFQTQFFDAHKYAWATKVDWFFHNIKRM